VLASDREVVAIDQRGFGESGWSPTRSYDLRQQAADVIAVLDYLGWERAVLMGHSMGGRICVCTAAWYPERTKALISVDFAPDLGAAGRKNVANSIGRQPDVFASVEEAISYHHGAPESRERYEAFLRKVEGGYQLKRDLHYRDQFRQVLETGKSHQTGVDAWALFSEIEVPMLVIRASRSQLFEAVTMDKARAANSSCEVVELEGDHDLAHDNPDGLVALVREFLRRNDL
jgi:pimeloyl-ACP methyl ester carboxylesterase